MQPPERPDLLDRHTTDMVVVVDELGRLAWMSPSVTRLLGYPPAELLGTQVVTLIHADEQDRAAKALAEMSSDQVSSDAYRVRHYDGSWRHLRLTGQCEPEGSGVVVALHDVTDQLQREAELRRRVRTEDLLRRISLGFIDLAPDALEPAIRQALADIARFCAADRAWLVTFDHDNRVAERVAEWSAPNVARMSPGRQRVPFDRLASLLDPLFQVHPVVVHSVEQLDATSPLDSAAMRHEGIRSMLALPITRGGRLAAAIGFETVFTDRAWIDDDIAVLRSASGLFSQALARRDVGPRDAETLEVFLQAFTEAPMGVALIDERGVIVVANPRLAEMLGAQPDQLPGANFFDLLHPTEDEVPLLTADDMGAQVATVQLHRGDHRAWVRVTVQGHTESGSPRAAMVEDVTEQRNVQAALAASERRARALLDNLPDPVVRVNRQGEQTFANRAAQRVRITAATEDAGAAAEAARAPGFEADDRGPLHEGLEEVLATAAPYVVEYETLEDETNPRFLEARMVPEFGDHGVVESVLVVSRDVTDQRNAETELARQALHDVLTSLPNRKLFMSHLEYAVASLNRHPSVLAVLFFDLDKFKSINDTLGHHIGDEVLLTAARRLRAALRPEDVVGRLGGDEFVVLLENLRDPAEAVHTAHRLQQALQPPMSHDGHEVMVQASIGIAIATEGSVDPQELVRRADTAMLRAKTGGRGRIEVFDEVLQAQVANRMTLESELRHAVEIGQLEVHYQPEVDLVTGETVGVEALVRWRHPDRGLIVARDFISLASETGLIVAIGTQVLTEACRVVQSLNRLRPGRPLVCHVNVSPRELGHSELLRAVGSALESSGLSPSLLCLEITEHTLMADPATSMVLLSDLDALGVRVTVDDFGTGASSISALQRFPLTALKIDREFVAGLPDDPTARAVVGTIVALARALDLEVIAEGIETEEQANALVRLGCRTGQGFLYAAPSTAAAFPAW